MESNRPTLLAKLAPMFATHTENLAVEALGHILAGSERALHALSELVRAGGAEIKEIRSVRTQATREGGERPDLVAVGADGAERVLIEAKFWAGLTGRQPGDYLKGLETTQEPSALLFVAPDKRMESLWNELRRLVSDESSLTFDPRREAGDFRSADVGKGRSLMLTSWPKLLGLLKSVAEDPQREMDIRQLQGLAEREDGEAFLPLRRDEFGPEIPRRLRGLQRLIDDAAGRCKTQSFDKNRKTSWNSTYGRYLRKEDPTVWFGVHYELWSRTESTPLWLWCWGCGSDVLDRLADLDALREDPSAAVPIHLPVGKEYDPVLDAVVERLEKVGKLIDS